ncbi:cytochrome P450 [Massarina eburnea CBS 473.64]|uniref:Cytochrome P450 n=1 Tax=Massarina eburnea CBS 473.64 TaxID=1395130 RepID=A0A6A6SHN3_9PLEO|nr:cytochrome P450 [Massarina eburnea CBS 473.64]
MEIHTYTTLAVVSALAWFLYIQLYNWRFRPFSHIPQYYPNSLLFGGIKTIAGAFKRLGDLRRHPDYAFQALWRESGYPQINFYDLRPLNPAMVVVNSHEVAEQIAKASKIHPWSVTKSPTMADLQHLIGDKSMLSAEGETWKALRKRFNPGFAPQHLITLLPIIIQKSSVFMKRLDALAESDAEADMEPLCTDLTFDIIGDVVCNLDLQAQDETSGGHEVVGYFRQLIKTFVDTGYIPMWMNVPNRIRRIYYSNKADASIKQCIKDKFAEMKAEQKTDTNQTKSRSVLALALRDIDVLTKGDLQTTADQVKTFFFAGHDTTSTMLQRLFYSLSIEPKRLQILRAEHDAVFGNEDPRDVFLARPDETLKGLTYTSACIKETLRLWPPGSSARLSVPGKGFKIRLDDGQEVCLDGTLLYIAHFLIQRDPKVFGETADEFVPERWLGDTDTTASKLNDVDAPTDEKKIPISAWRPFERGPKNCIGQELANLEARVILACVMRRYDFVKVGPGEVLLDEKGKPAVDDNGRYKTNGELFNAIVITSKPFDKCRMKIKMHEAE